MTFKTLTAAATALTLTLAPGAFAESTPTAQQISTTKGASLMSEDGKMLGTISSVSLNGQGNPEMIISLADDTGIEGDELKLTGTVDQFAMMDGSLVVLETAQEINTKAGLFKDERRDERPEVTLVN